MAINKYWTGQQQAKILTIASISAAWGRGDGAANRFRMLNGAFEIYYILKTSIANCPDSDLRELMTKELDDAGEAGWGTGVNDMDDAFQHWIQPGNWTDNNQGNYAKAHGIFGAASPGIT